MLLINYLALPHTLPKWVSLRFSLIGPYKTNNTGLGFHEDITKLMNILKKNLLPAHLIEKAINRCITGTQNNHCPRGSLPATSPT